MKIFLDANIFIAACGNTSGGSAYIFNVAAIEPSWHLLTSTLALYEARKNIHKKLPNAIQEFERLLVSPALTIVESPPIKVIDIAKKIIATKDAPLLAAAICAKAKYFCTLDQKDFHTPQVKTWCRKRGLSIVTPRDLLVHWRTMIVE